MSSHHPNEEPLAPARCADDRPAPLRPMFRASPNAALGLALYALRRAGSAKEAIAIIDALPASLHGAVIEGAASRELVASPIIAALVRHIGWRRLSSLCGRELALSIIRRHMPDEYDALFGGRAQGGRA